jgi:heat shock protein HspQ
MSKFKVGDIIRHKEHIDYKYEVIEITPEYYKLQCVNPHDRSFKVEKWRVDENARLLTKLEKVLK